MTRITDLPVEILQRIFQSYLESENQFKLISLLSSVCKTWKSVCENSALWVKFDGTIPYKIMKKLCSKGSLNSTKELTISYTECLKDEDAEKLFSCLKNIEIIDFSQVEDFSMNIITILAQSSLNLRGIQIGNPKQTNKRRSFRLSELHPFFSSKGSTLTTIKLSYCNIKNSSQVLKCISENCPNLEHFHFTNNDVGPGVFPTKHFQLNCPKLRILHLDHNVKIGAAPHPLGFRNLEVFTYNDLSFISHITDKDIENMLFNSPNLKFLSLINCSLSVDTLCSLPANSVEYIFLPRSRIVNSNNLSDLFKKWCYSMKQVDISYSTNMSINDAILILTKLPVEPSIEFLDLSFTQVTSDTVMKILEKCKRIETLHLLGCRNLSRGLKRNYSSKAELKVLFEKLQTSAYDDTTDEE